MESFIYGLIIGGIAGAVVPTPSSDLDNLVNSIVIGIGGFPIIDRFVHKETWKEIYKRTPFYVSGLFSGVTIAQCIKNSYNLFK